MKNKFKIGIWGQFGDGGKISDGQAVRTTIITNELKKRYGKENVSVVNSNGWKKRPFAFLLETMSLIKNCEKVIIFPADNGFKMIVPIYDFLNVFYRKTLIDVVIGGYLPGILENSRIFVRMLKKYRALFVQTENLKSDIEEFGLTNVRILSNLKDIYTRNADEIKLVTDENIRVCTLSRITNDKGIKEAIFAVDMFNQKLGKTVVTLDIYGEVASEFKIIFDELLNKYSDIASYKGVLDFDKTSDTLKDYFALLFPTYYYGEGFPGCVVDAYNAGIPIIATNWNYNADVIKDGVNGILVKPLSVDEVAEALLRLYNDREYHREISQNNAVEAQKYKPDVVLKDFYSIIDEQ